MLVLCLHIIITDPKDTYTLEFTSANAVEIESSWKNLTGLAKISFPRHIRLKNSVYDDINDVILRGSKVEVFLGYDGNMVREFTGYVARVNAKIPFTVECEDEMWKLKQTTYTNVWRNVNLQELVAYIYKGKAIVSDINIGSYRIVKASAAKVLADLKEKLGVYSYFRYDETINEPVLYVGLGGYEFPTSNKPIYNFNKNVVDNDLTYRLKEDIKLKVKASSLQRNGKEIEVEVGDDDGDTSTLHCPWNLSKADLTRYANEKLKLMVREGYKGSITGFGVPYVKHGDAVKVEDNMFPERDGFYFADSVKTTFGTGGFRRNVELGYKAS